MADADAALVDTTVAGYRLGSLIAAGTDGARVYTAVADDTGAPVTVRLAPLGDATAAQRFETDATALAGIRNANVPEVLGHGEAPEGLYAVSAEIAGSELSDLIGDGLPPLRAVKLLGDVADALDRAHGAHLLHRGVRAGNIVVADRPVERAYLTSFELGRARDSTEVAPEQTPYVSPEEARGEPATPASDVYSLACVLYECVAGQPPFGSEPDAARRGHLAEEPGPASQLRPEIPPALDAVLARGLAKAPADRHQSAGDLLSAAARTAFAIGSPEAAPPPAVDPMVAEAATAFEPATQATSELPPAAPAPLPGPPVRRIPSWALVLLLAGAAALGWVAANALNDDGPARAEANGVDLVVPSGWKAPDRPAELAGLGIQLPLAYESAPGARAGLIAGLVPGQRILIDPRALAARIQTDPPRPEAVSLGDLKAWRWNGLKTRGPARVLNLYAAPSSAGTAVVACYAPRGGDTPSACNDAAGSLRVPGERSFDPAQGAAWRANVLKATATLARRRQALRRQLVRPRGPAAQARAARAIAAAHSGALAGIERGGVPQQAAAPHSQISTALKALAADYNRLGRAASRRNRTAFRRAQRAIARDDARLRRELRRI
jgi:hypothetical protein